jgi:hypothetical protein
MNYVSRSRKSGMATLATIFSALSKARANLILLFHSTSELEMTLKISPTMSVSKLLDRWAKPS